MLWFPPGPTSTAAVLDLGHTLPPSVAPPPFSRRVGMIDAGADVNMQDNDGNTPLHAVVYSTKTETDDQRRHAAHLLAVGADLSIANRRGASPIVAAMERGNMRLLTFLLEHRAQAWLATHFAIMQALAWA